MNSILDPQTARHTAPMTHSADVHLSEDQIEDHLSDDQIDDHLIGDLAAEPALHLDSCSACSERVAAAALPIAHFDSATLAWSERRSATLPLPALSEQRPVWQRHMAWVTTTFALAIGMAVVNLGHQINANTASIESAPRYSTTTPASLPALTETASVAADPAPAQVSADNKMLRAINEELDSSTETPAQLGLEPVDAHPARALATIAVQD